MKQISSNNTKLKHKMFLPFLTLTGALLLSGNQAMAQEASNYTTREVVVEADRAKEAAKYNPQKVTIITAKDIEEKQAKTVEDIIFNETGVSRTVDSMGRVGVSIRGAEARHTLILVDGQPVLGEFAKYMGAADEVSRLGTENVERIEIIQGAASTQYGSDAIGGVINIITKKAQDKPQIQFNIEGRKTAREIKGMQNSPYSNYFLRVDTGKIGKGKYSFYGNKRDVMPVFAQNERRKVGSMFARKDMHEFPDNSLRYHGVTSSAGLMGTYDINATDKIEIRTDKFKENLHKFVKRSNSDMEPMLHFKRNATRDALNFSYSGRKDKLDWVVEANYNKMKEDDIALTTDFSSNAYEGKNTLQYVDDIDHRQIGVKTSLKYAANDNHLITLGAGFSKEYGSGSRLKSAPKTYLKSIDPWDYDKALFVEPLRNKDVAKFIDKEAKSSSRVHAYKFLYDKNNVPRWDINYETVGYDEKDPNSKRPPIDFDTYINNQYELNSWTGVSDPKLKKAKAEFNALLKEENGERLKVAGIKIYDDIYMREYYKANPEYNLTFNGKKFFQNFEERQNKVLFGEANINKYFLTLQDTWNINDDTILNSTIRYDHSSLFNGNISLSAGVTHNYKGDPHTRLKANIGTSYAEPGMGELYYHWEMYSGNPTGFGLARMGWYWVGNPNLQPEKSLNFDLGFEKELKNTSIKASVFHNNINNYLSVYFTGELLDFYPFYNSSSAAGFWKFLFPPDMIYSFKNIGKATITGADLEVKQKFGKNWDMKLGYTYLNALNKSDPTMPDKLLDKPTHKVDIGLNYKDEKHGWLASIWGNYYIDMLDSNGLASKGSYMETFDWGDPHPRIEYNFKHGEKQVYNKKTYGIWNFMLQKKFDKDNLAYFGIDNVFNHRDDDRALQERVYKIGVNLKSAEIFDTSKAIDQTTGLAIKPENTPFIEKYSLNKDKDVHVFGDIRFRNDFNLGENKPPSLVSDTSIISPEASKNLKDNEIGTDETRIKLGVQANINESTTAKISGEITTINENDKHDLNHNKKIKTKKLIEANISKNSNKVNYSIGRVNQKFGTTGYWFNDSFDGIKATYTNEKSQINIGYGSFKHNTGISDSPYTHAVYREFLRPPYIEEFFGVARSGLGFMSGGLLPEENSPNNASGLIMPKGNDNVAFMKQIYDIGKKYINDYKDKNDTDMPVAGGFGYKPPVLDDYPVMEVVGVLKHMQKEVLKAYGNNPKLFNTGPIEYAYASNAITSREFDMPKDKLFLTLNTKDGIKYYGEYNNLNRLTPAGTKSSDKKDFWSISLSDYNDKDKEFKKSLNLSPFVVKLDDPDIFDGNTKDELLKKWWDKHGSDYMSETEKLLRYKLDDPSLTITTPPDEVRKQLVESLFLTPDNQRFMGINDYGDLNLPNVVTVYTRQIEKALEYIDGGALIPREALAATGYGVRIKGTVLERDEVPAIDRALFIQGKYMLRDNLGLAAWHLRSLGDKTFNIEHANGQANDVYSYNKYANIFGIGFDYRPSEYTKLSFDYGMNFTKFGRHLNGNTKYEHPEGTNIFRLKGYKEGSTPKFYTIRFDVGASDINIPDSWNAFLDYKYFEHGSFFGGNGTDSLPDRYLDGIKSFTFGASYVPARNWLVEAFYTFGAEGINKRDTLFGSENFKLGNLARAQISYRF